MKAFNRFLTLVLFLHMIPSYACKWQESQEAYASYKVKVGFIGKLYERASTTEVVNNADLWAKFEPVFVIHGEWNRLQKVKFPDTSRNYELLEELYYLIHTDEAGNFVEPCNFNLRLMKFSSTEEKSFKEFVTYVRSLSTEQRWNGEFK